MSLAKAELRTEAGDVIKCLFNPAEISIAKSNTWSAGESKGKNAPDLRFQSGASATLSMTLMLDTTDTGDDVSRHTSRLLELMQVDSALAGADRPRNAARPPWVEFHWGSMHSFRAVVEQLQLQFTYFSNLGVPLRAKADLTLKQWKDAKNHPLQNPTSRTDRLHAVHQVLPGQTLDRIAAIHYGDPTRWRLIAQTNQISDPLALPDGGTLVIPELPVRRRG